MLRISPPTQKTMIKLLITIGILIGICNTITPATKIQIPSYWQLKIDNCPQQPSLTGLIVNTTIPTVLHLDLLKYQKIQDPFFGANHLQLQWVSRCNVTYSTNLTIQKKANIQQLVFQGIDTYSTIKFNGKQLLKTNNSFVQYRIQLNKRDINYGQSNLLEVQIYSAQKFDLSANKVNSMPFIYAHSRKAAYQYSWDWAPKLITMGIWKPVYLITYDIAIHYVWARNRLVSKNEAIINFAVALTDSLKNIDKKCFIEIQVNSTPIVKRQVKEMHQYIDVVIKQPKLWWPNGIGQPYVYNFQVLLLQFDGTIVDRKNITYGIRTIELDQQNNKFTVIVNGYPVYCKGANYVPPDMFYPRTSNPDYKPGNTYKQLLDDAVQSHFNMIRLWGGGQYQSTQFLELASRKGIMLFYDFMFSDSIYPSSFNFLVNVEAQITHQVRIARNYPCLALWSGNNEIYQGIKSWGWSSQKYKSDFIKLFEKTIPAILKKEDPYTPYISSSPVNGIGNGGFEAGGDIHYWGVWAGGMLFESYLTALGPFNSQFGTQAIPVWQTVKNFTNQQGRNYQSQQFRSHEKHNSGFNTLRKYINHYGHTSRNFEMQTYLSGLVQAYGIQIAIISQRVAKPKSYGTLYWQFNDAWPAISWSSIDYYGRWKPLQYMAKRLYPDVAVFCHGGKIIAVNDNLYTVSAVVLVRVQYLNGTLIYNNTHQITLAQNQVKTLQQTNYRNQKNQVVVYTQIIAGRQKQMFHTFFFEIFKQLQLDPTAKLFVNLVPQHNLLILHTDKFIKNLYISSTKQYIKLSDNYFDMIKDKKYKIYLSKNCDMRQIKNTLVFRSYLQIHQDTQLTVVYQSSK